MQTVLVVAAVVAVGIATLALRRRKGRARAGADSMAALYASDPEIAEQRAPDYAFIDGYLARWDRFAQGANDLMPGLMAEVRRFNAELAFALRTEAGTAMGRAIFYPVLQVGGFVPLDSAVGRALAEAWGAEPPPTTVASGRRYYFAGDLYFWWEANRARFEPFRPYEEWREREFARNTAIPMYEGVRSRR